jgi:hypothetical protein
MCIMRSLFCASNHSISRKALYPPSPHPETWEAVMHEHARARVKQYIVDVVPKQLGAQTHEAVRSRFPEIHLRPCGVEVSDGYRPPVGRAFPQPFLEENATSIVAMGIATRGRALQVLESNQNNLEESVNVLLALLT